MKKLFLFLTILFSMVISIPASAYDFSAANDDGVNIYYTVTSATNLTVEVSYGNTINSSYAGEVNIPSSVSYFDKEFIVTAIGENAFNNCHGLTSVTIPTSVTSINPYAFCYCSGLISVTIPTSVTSIGSWCFCACSSLTSVTIPESVTSIADDAFYCCTSLTSVTIPNSVISIWWEAFYGCTGLTSVILGENLYEISNNAFYDCDNIKDVWSMNPIPPICDENAFKAITCMFATLHVPEGATDAYQTAEVWKEFETIVEEDAPIKDKCAAPTLSVSDDYAIVAESETQDAQIHLTVNCADAGTYSYDNGEPLDMTGIYNVNAYATADGYSKSDTTRAILVWVKVFDSTTGIDVLEMNTDRALLLSSVGDKIGVNGCGAKEAVAVYDIAGNQLYAGETDADYYVIPISLTEGNIYFVTIAGRTIKYLF